MVYLSKEGIFFFGYFTFFQPVFAECDKKQRYGQTEIITFK